MSENSDTVMAVTRDIVVAMIQKQNSGFGAGHPVTATDEIVKAFSAIYETVKKKRAGQ